MNEESPSPQCLPVSPLPDSQSPDYDVQIQEIVAHIENLNPSDDGELSDLDVTYLLNRREGIGRTIVPLPMFFKRKFMRFQHDHKLYGYNQRDKIASFLDEFSSSYLGVLDVQQKEMLMQKCSNFVRNAWYTSELAFPLCHSKDEHTKKKFYEDMKWIIFWNDRKNIWAQQDRDRASLPAGKEILSSSDYLHNCSMNVDATDNGSLQFIHTSMPLPQTILSDPAQALTWTSPQTGSSSDYVRSSSGSSLQSQLSSASSSPKTPRQSLMPDTQVSLQSSPEVIVPTIQHLCSLTSSQNISSNEDLPTRAVTTHYQSPYPPLLSHQYHIQSAPSTSEPHELSPRSQMNTAPMTDAASFRLSNPPLFKSHHGLPNFSPEDLKCGTFGNWFT